MNRQIFDLSEMIHAAVPVQKTGSRPRYITETGVEMAYEHLLSVQDLRTTFTTDNGDVQAVNGVSFNLDEGNMHSRYQVGDR